MRLGHWKHLSKANNTIKRWRIHRAISRTASITPWICFLIQMYCWSFDLSIMCLLNYCQHVWRQDTFIMHWFIQNKDINFRIWMKCWKLFFWGFLFCCHRYMKSNTSLQLAVFANICERISRFEDCETSVFEIPQSSESESIQWQIR